MFCLDGGTEDPSLPWPAPETAGGSGPSNYGHPAICSPSMVGCASEGDCLIGVGLKDLSGDWRDRGTSLKMHQWKRK